MQTPSSITTRLQYQHKSLLDLIDGLTDEQVRRNVIAGKWSIYEHIVHLQTYQHVFARRMKHMLIEDGPSFPVYTAEADPEFLDNLGKPSREIMQDLLVTRKELLAEVVKFQANELQRKGFHPTYGPMNMVQWLHFFLLHEAHHLFTIFKLAAILKQPAGN